LLKPPSKEVTVQTQKAILPGGKLTGTNPVCAYPIRYLKNNGIWSNTNLALLRAEVPRQYLSRPFGLQIMDAYLRGRAITIMTSTRSSAIGQPTVETTLKKGLGISITWKKTKRIINGLQKHSSALTAWPSRA
jgi:hypothetical protein